jgi:phospholipid/cholesterol/gamma-HCH transport system substrate-binding protein
MTTRFIEIMVGVFIALGFAALFMLAMKVSNLSSFAREDGYDLTAYFRNIGGLKVRSPVAVSGVKVGQVSSISFDPKVFKARVQLTLDNSYNYFPIDSSASIYTAGLLGEQYISLTPGAEDETLKGGDQIENTHDALVLEEFLGNVVSKIVSK